MAMTRKYEGVKLVKKTIYLEKEDIETFEKYGLIVNKNFASLVRNSMNKEITGFKIRIKKDEIENKQI